MAVVALLLVAVVAAPAAARDDPPTSLWEEYPLHPAEPADTPAAKAPFTPPVGRDMPASGITVFDPGQENGGGENLAWRLAALAALALGAVALLVGSRVVRAGAGWAISAGARAKPQVSSEAVLRPGATCVVHPVGDEPSRFVAELEHDGGRRLIATSQPFRSVRSSGKLHLDAEAWRAWHGLIDELEAAGWQLLPAWGAQSGDPITAEEACDLHLVLSGARAADVEARERPDSARSG